MRLDMYMCAVGTYTSLVWAAIVRKKKLLVYSCIIKVIKSEKKPEPA
mgnify:CR=1 FL=1